MKKSQIQLDNIETYEEDFDMVEDLVEDLKIPTDLISNSSNSSTFKNIKAKPSPLSALK
jgi:hypothetical protein